MTLRLLQPDGVQQGVTDGQYVAGAESLATDRQVVDSTARMLPRLCEGQLPVELGFAAGHLDD
ncbi:MAG TPA: hypothetical protein VM510_07210, partial [Caulifigura sp.]|nr:hypothetical protein [Caulifigura sp.]